LYIFVDDGIKGVVDEMEDNELLGMTSEEDDRANRSRALIRIAAGDDVSEALST
uniref:Transferred entry: 7.1.2.2 n=1 Tax=Anisakis simplex TaxID=6269 RepID=A0A0M3JPM3_ANISI